MYQDTHTLSLELSDRYLDSRHPDYLISPIQLGDSPRPSLDTLDKPMALNYQFMNSIEKTLKSGSISHELTRFCPRCQKANEIYIQTSYKAKALLAWLICFPLEDVAKRKPHCSACHLDLS